MEKNTMPLLTIKKNRINKCPKKCVVCNSTKVTINEQKEVHCNNCGYVNSQIEKAKWIKKI
uniref:Uncharacterized protein n=2 Tax=viral metagenome TaxID=1070528 RepID=A0A6M3JGJ7_9ZZZZ